MSEQWDAIVVGSGIGGLAAASVLARVGQKRVLVLEQHLERGGLTHAFRREGASWDVGVHYVGNLEPGSSVRQWFDYFTDGRLAWNRLPDSFERFRFPGRDFGVPGDPKDYLAALVQEFPDEETGLRRYFRDLRRAAGWSMSRVREQLVPAPVAAGLRGWRGLTTPLATATTEEVLRRHIDSPELRALLAAQWGDYGLPPSESAFALHALVTTSYFGGAGSQSVGPAGSPAPSNRG